MTTYRIKKGVRPHGGKLFRVETPDTRMIGWPERLIGYVQTTYKELGPYAYDASDIEEVEWKNASWVAVQ